MKKRLQAQNLYKAKLISEIPAISSSGNPLEVFEIDVDVAPTYDMGWVWVDFNDVTKRDLIFYHAKSGTKLYYYRKNRDKTGTGAIDMFHEENALIQENDVSQWINKIYSNMDDFGEIEYPWGAANELKVMGTTVQYGRQTYTVSDTVLTIPNGTYEVVFKFFDATFDKVLTADLDLKNHLHIATVVASGGSITSVTDKRSLILSNDMPPQSDWWIFEDETVVPVNNFGYGTDDIPNDSLEVPGSTTTNALDNLLHMILNNNVYGASSGGTDNYTISAPTASLALASGLVIRVKADVSNTGSASVTVTSLGTIPIKKNVNEDLSTGDIQAGQIFELFYDGTNAQLNSPFVVIPKDTFVAGEGFSVGDIPFKETAPATGDATIARAIGSDNARKRVEIRLIGNGSLFNQFKVNLSKQGAPTGDLNWRFEQETNGLPNGVLIDNNAVGAQTAAGLSTSAAEKTINLVQNVSWTGPMWLVGYMGASYSSPTVDATNYYNIYHSRRTTTTRQFRYFDGTGYGKLYSDNFEALDTSLWTYGSTHTLTDGKLNANIVNTSMFTSDTFSAQTFTQGYIEIGATVTSASDGFGTPGIISTLLYKDQNNYAEIRHNGGGIDQIAVVIGGVSVYTNNPGISASPVSIKITYDFTSHDIKFWYRDSGVWTQMGTTQTYNIGDTLRAYFSSRKGGGAGGGITPTIAYFFAYGNNVAQAQMTYDSYPFVYVSSAGIRDEVLAHADTDYYWKNEILGIINKSYNAGETAAFYNGGIPLLQSSVTGGVDIFLNKRTIGTTPSAAYLGESTFDGLRVKLNLSKKVFTKTTYITPAQILTMNTTPIALVPKPAANQVIVPQRITMSVEAGSDYATNTNLAVCYKDLTGTRVADIASLLVSSGQKKMATINANGDLLISSGSFPQTITRVGVMYPTIGEALVLGVTGGNPTAGTKAMVVQTHYSMQAV